MKSTPSRKSKGAFSLIEVTLALGVAGFCLISIFGLLPVGLRSNQASHDQTMASNISSAIVSDLRNATNGSGQNVSPRFGFTIPVPSGSGNAISTTPPQTVYLASDGSFTNNALSSSGPITVGANVSVYRATIAFGTPASGQRTATPVRVFITWPALADGNPGNWPSNYSGSYDADTTLNRN